MAIFDYFIIGILTASMLFSIRRGFVKEALSLLTWIAAVVVSRLFAGHLSVLLESQIETDLLRIGASYVILFIGTLMTGGIVNFVMSEFVKMTGLTNTDRFLGMLFGLARGGLAVLLVVAVLHYFAPVEDEAWYKQSRLVPEIIMVIEKLSPILWEQGEALIRGGKEEPFTN